MTVRVLVGLVGLSLLNLSLRVSAREASSPPSAKVRMNHIQPLSEDLLRVNGESLYIENIFVNRIDPSRIKEDLAGREPVNLKVEGLQKWDVYSLQAMYQCQGKSTYWMLPTSNPEIWLLKKNWCKDSEIRFCLSDMRSRFVCSAWHYRKTLKPVRESRVYKKPTKSFQLPYGRTLKWVRSDGSYMKIRSVEKFAKSNRRNEFPSFYSSLLLSAVSSVDALLFLGTGQLMYWPKPSLKGSLLFDPARIGALLRVSQSINSVPLIDGRSLTADWYDFSINYRQKPQGIFETDHIYTFMTYSSFHALSRTTNRLGGGIGYSFPWPESVFGWRYPGKIISYVDFSFLPLDISGDNKGIIVSSKANGIWLFSNNFFVTGDIELRLLNFTLSTENSVMRFQFGGGWSF